MAVKVLVSKQMKRLNKNINADIQDRDDRIRD